MIPHTVQIAPIEGLSRYLTLGSVEIGKEEFGGEEAHYNGGPAPNCG